MICCLGSIVECSWVELLTWPWVLWEWASHGWALKVLAAPSNPKRSTRTFCTRPPALCCPPLQVKELLHHKKSWDEGWTFWKVNLWKFGPRSLSRFQLLCGAACSPWNAAGCEMPTATPAACRNAKHPNPPMSAGRPAVCQLANSLPLQPGVLFARPWKAMVCLTFLSLSTSLSLEHPIEIPFSKPLRAHLHDTRSLSSIKTSFSTTVYSPRMTSRYI